MRSSCVIEMTHSILFVKIRKLELLGLKLISILFVHNIDPTFPKAFFEFNPRSRFLRKYVGEHMCRLNHSLVLSDCDSFDHARGKCFATDSLS